VRIVHGGRDPLVPVSDKEWLRDELRRLHPGLDVELQVYDDGDHCCTAYAAQTRDDAASFFSRVL
jgi:predicted esterase